MASIRAGRAFRARASAGKTVSTQSLRLFSSTISKQKPKIALPKFSPTSDPELDAIFLTLRQKHFIPAWLPKQEQKYIFNAKYRQFLEDNPLSVKIGDEEIQLQWMDKHKSIEKRWPLIDAAIQGMKTADPSAWDNIIPLLAGLHELDALPSTARLAKIQRAALESGRIDVVLECLSKPDVTAMTLKNEEILWNTLWSIRNTAQRAGWSSEATQMALQHVRRVAALLEKRNHGGKRPGSALEMRSKPTTIGVFLEIAAMQAYKHQDGKDIDGTVNALAQRMTESITVATQAGLGVEVFDSPFTVIQQLLPSVQGLKVAKSVLGNDMPNQKVADQWLEIYETQLQNTVQSIERNSPEAGTYHHTALTAWQDRIPV